MKTTPMTERQQARLVRALLAGRPQWVAVRMNRALGAYETTGGQR